MATFPTAPGVHVTEKDLSTIVPAVSTTDGALVGYFKWGPVEDIKLISSQEELSNAFGKPYRNANGTFFWSASNFLDYSNRIHVMRVSDGTNATWDGTAATVLNDADYVTKFDAGSIGAGYFVAKYPGTLGNSIQVSMVDGTEGFNSRGVKVGSTISLSSGDTTIDFSNKYTDDTINQARDVFTVGDSLTIGGRVGWGRRRSTSALSGEFKVINVGGLAGAGDANTITISNPITRTLTSTTVFRKWEHYHNFDNGPSTSNFCKARGITDDELHIIVSDKDGGISGVPGTVLERYMHVSKASDATDSEGATIYFKDVIDAQSKYIRVSRNEPTTNWGNSTSDLSGTSYTALNPGVFSNTFSGGTDHTATETLLENGWQLMADADQKDLSLLVGSAPATNNINRTIVEVAEDRTDCVAFISPHYSDVVGLVDQEDIAQNIIDHRNDGLLSLSSSYGVMDSGWKYQFDKYNNIYRWTPLNADVAGLCARTDTVRDAWWSPAGFQRGNIKNVVKLAWNPSEVFREELYKNGINPVVTFPGQGTVLFGDKTMLTRPSAFDRINVRRLFIVLEKAISRAAQYSLFEFNDDFTRAQFKNMIEPFLRDIQGRQGIYDFRVVCDETNNTGQVIDLNQFVGDIYIKPARSINFIQLNFIVARSGVDFTEITGR